MELKHLRYFLAVSEHGSFTKAATVLGVAQPLISATIRDLEAELSAELFYRNGRGATLTEAGQRFLEPVKRSLEALDQAKNETVQGSSIAAGRVRLGLAPSMAEQVGLDVARDFAAACPRAELSIIEAFSGQINEWLVDGRVDVALLNRAIHSPHIAVEPLMEERLELIVHRDLARRLGFSRAPLEFADVANLPIVLPTGPNGLRRLVDAVAKRTQVAPQIVLEADSMPVIRNCIRSGYAAAILPPSSVRDLLSQSDILRIEIGTPGLTNEILLASCLNRPTTVAGKALMQILRRRLKSASISGSAGQAAPMSDVALGCRVA